MFGGLLLFSIIPFIQNILYSFRKMGTFGDGTFVGLANYRKLLTDDTFWLALKNTVFYAVVGVPLVIVFSIYLAHLLNKKLRGRTLYRTLLFIPAVTIPAAIGILWRWILNYQYGIFNWLLEKLGLPPGVMVGRCEVCPLGHYPCSGLVHGQHICYHHAGGNAGD